MNQREQVFLNSCEIILQEYSIKHKGHIYFIWRKGKKHIQSLKYPCNQQKSPMKQTLTLSLKTYSINGILQKKYTNFSLYDSDNKQLDTVKLDVSEWKNQSQSKTISIGGCSLKIRVKRKVALQLQNFHRHAKAEIQQSSGQSERQSVKQYHKNHKREQLSIKEELAKAKRQIEDFDFMTNKLKNDRNYYITENQALRNELAQIHTKYAEQLNALKDHYQNRIEIRQSIYEEQIQQMISTFNSNYQINIALMESLIKQKYDYQTEIFELKEAHQHYIQKQQENYQGIIAELQQNKNHMDLQIKDCLNKIHDRQSTITELKQELQETNITLNETKSQLNRQIQDHSKDNQDLEKVIEQKQTKIYKHLDEIEALKIQIDTKDFQIKQSQNLIEQLRMTITELEKDKIENQKINNEISTQRYNLQIEIEKLKVTIQQLNGSIEYNQATIQQLKQQGAIKEQQFTTQYKSLQEMYAEKQLLYENQMKSQHQKFLAVNKENYDLNLKIQQLEHDIAISTDQINILKNDQQQTNDLNNQLREEMKQQTEAFAKQYRQYNEQIADLMSENNVFQAETTALKDEVRELQSRLEIQTSSLKRDYEQLLESKAKLYEDQMEFLKNQKTADMEGFDKMKVEYEHQIANLLQRESKQAQDMQKMFKDEMELKNQQYLELHERHKLMEQAYEDLKLRIQIAEENNKNQNQGQGRRGRGKKGKNNELSAIQQQSLDMDIEEIDSDEEDSEEEQSDSDLQSSQQVVRKKKKKNKGKDKKKDKNKKKEKEKSKKKKKKPISSSEEQSSQQEPSESEVDQSQEHSQILGEMDQEFKAPTNNIVKVNKEVQNDPKVEIDQNQNIALSQSQVYKSANTGQVISMHVPDVPNMDFSQSSPGRTDGGKNKKKNVIQDSLSNSGKGVKKQKVDQLQRQIKKLKKEIKSYERNQTVHLTQIQDLEDQVKTLNNQIDALLKKISKKDPKLGRKLSNQVQDKREQKSDSNRSRSQHSVRVPPPMPRKQMENLKMQNQYLKRTMQQKNKAIHEITLQKQNLTLKLKTIQMSKNENDQKLIMYQSKMQGMSQQQSQSGPKTPSFNQDQGLRKSLSELEHKFLSEKEKIQQIKMQKNQIAFEKEQLENDKKRLQIKLEEVQKQLKQSQPTLSMKQMNKQLQEMNKQMLGLSKSNNSLKLQKESLEQEIRMLKKRYSQIIRASQESESKAQNFQRQSDQLRRKQMKSRRDAEDLQDEVKRYKQQIKQLQQDINSLNTVQTQSVYQRKKVLEDMNKLQDTISNKDYEITKLNKQIEKFKQKIQEGEQIKVGKRNQLLADRERLDALVIKGQKRNQQLEEERVHLKQRIDLLERQNKKNLDEKKQTYSEKLKFYIQEISNIKQIVQEYQNENSRLKIQNSEFFEHNQILKISFEKLEAKYEQVVENEERLLEQLQGVRKQLDGLMASVNQKNQQTAESQKLINTLRIQLDHERNFSKKKTDKLQAYEQLNQKYIYQIKALKIKLSQYDTNINQNQLLIEKCQKSSKTIQQLEQELRKWQEDYQHVTNVFTYRKEDVEKAMQELKEHEEKVKEEQISKVIEELDSTYSSKQASMEQEIIELFNENSKLRLSLQNKNDQLSESLLKIAQFQHLPDKVRVLQKERDQFQRVLCEVEEQLKSKGQELRRAEAKLYESIRSQEGKGTENAILLKKCEDLEKKLKDISDSYAQLKRQEKKLIQRIKTIGQSKEQVTQNLNNQIQHYQNKILSLQLQLNRLKQNQSNGSKQNNAKIKKLEDKMSEMSDAFKQHEETLEKHYLGQVKKLQEANEGLTQELEQKLSRIEELNEALIMIQEQNDELVNELTNTRTQLSEENQIFTNQINNLRNQYKQAEEIYDGNIRTLQDQMSALSKELTTLRYHRQNSSRLSGSGVDDKNKRVDEKIKLKDKKIEELKTSILMMQQTITKLMKKETNNENLTYAETEKLKANLTNVEVQLLEARQKYQFEVGQLNETIQKMRKSIMEWKNKNEQKELLLEEKNLEHQSLSVELSTTKELYAQLQKELQKRKSHLNTQLEEESYLQSQLRNKNLKITELTQKLEQTTTERNKIDAELKRKVLELKRVNEKLSQLEINYRDSSSTQQKKSLEIKALRQQIKEIDEELKKEQGQSKRVKNQLAIWQKENFQLKEQIENRQKTINDLSKTNGEIYRRNMELEAEMEKFTELQNKFEEENDISLQQFILNNYYNVKLDEKDRDIQVLAEELEEIRFLFDRKSLEYDDLRRVNYQLSIKTEDNDYVYQQMDNLRKMCDKLQNEKKNAIFREQALKIQIQNLVESEDKSQITEKLETILQNQYNI